MLSLLNKPSASCRHTLGPVHDAVHNSSILDGDFIRTGDSGVVSVGQLPEATPHDGTGVATFPSDNTIARCHFGGTGVYGKQTSALFVAVSRRITFTDNTLVSPTLHFSSCVSRHRASWKKQAPHSDTGAYAHRSTTGRGLVLTTCWLVLTSDGC